MLLICLSILLGAAAGLRFNVKPIFFLCTAAICAGAVLSIAGHTGSQFVTGLVAAIALQVGYFASVLIAAMGLTDKPSVAHVNSLAVTPTRGPHVARRD